MTAKNYYLTVYNIIFLTQKNLGLPYNFVVLTIRFSYRLAIGVLLHIWGETPTTGYYLKVDLLIAGFWVLLNLC